MYEDRAFAAERARESYRYYYMLRYPHDENESVRERRLSPLDGRGLALGGVFGEKNGWERVNYYEPGRPGRRAGADQRAWGWGRPAFFDRVGEEHRAVRERAGLLDMTSFGKIEVRGPGALALLQRLCGQRRREAARQRRLHAVPERARRHRGRPHGHPARPRTASAW